MSGCCAGALRDKEVINICDGSRLGYICDFAVDTCSGRLISISVPGHGRSVFNRDGYLIIPWCKIERIGEDIILVNINPDECSPPKRTKSKKNIWEHIKCFLDC